MVIWKSLKWRTLTLSLGVVTLAHLIYGYVVVSENGARAHADAQQHVEALTASTAEALSRPLWDFDMAQVEAALMALGEHDAVIAARLIDPDGKTIAALDRKAEPGLVGPTAAFPVIMALGAKREVLGELTISFSEKGLEDAIADHTRQTFSLSALAIGGVCLALLWIGGRATRPLVGMAGAIAAIREGDLDRPAPFVDRPDEIGDVARAIESFRKNAREVAELRAENDRLAGDERRRTRVALESMADAAVILDERGEVIFANAAALTLLPELHCGAFVTAVGLFCEDTRAALRDAVRDRLERRIDGVIEGREGGPRHLSLRISPIRNPVSGFLGTVIRASDVTDRITAQREIARLAEHDDLTGLPNRRVFERSLGEWIAHRPERAVQILLFDLDRFKAVNDLHGHPVGDELLRRIAGLLRTMVPRDALLARLGGDEFGVLFGDQDSGGGTVSAKAAGALAERILGRLADPQIIGPRRLRTGASAGVLTAAPGEISAADAMCRAELALYAAKRRGRGRAALYERGMAEDLIRRAELEDALRDAIGLGGIDVAFQPQQSARDGRLLGFEALARWRHPVLGAIGPAEFVPLAEERGLIADLSAAVITSACQAAAIWHDKGFRGHVAVNVSPIVFGDGVIQMLDAALDRTGCPAEAIEVEITETVLLSDDAANFETFDALKARGIRIALDDFGIGYSSLGYLSRFPVNRLKIDRCFVSELGETERAAAIVRAIAELGHALGMDVTAEGVETDLQAEILGRAGVDTLQGFLLGRPGSRATAYEAVQDAVLEAAGGTGPSRMVEQLRKA